MQQTETMQSCFASLPLSSSPTPRGLLAAQVLRYQAFPCSLHCSTSKRHQSNRMKVMPLMENSMCENELSLHDGFSPRFDVQLLTGGALSLQVRSWIKDKSRRESSAKDRRESSAKDAQA